MQSENGTPASEVSWQLKSVLHLPLGGQRSQQIPVPIVTAPRQAPPPVHCASVAQAREHIGACTSPYAFDNVKQFEPSLHSGSLSHEA